MITAATLLFVIVALCNGVNGIDINNLSQKVKNNGAKIEAMKKGGSPDTEMTSANEGRFDPNEVANKMRQKLQAMIASNPRLQEKVEHYKSHRMLDEELTESNDDDGIKLTSSRSERATLLHGGDSSSEDAERPPRDVVSSSKIVRTIEYNDADEEEGVVGGDVLAILQRKREHKDNHNRRRGHRDVVGVSRNEGLRGSVGKAWE
mmetsp:Transcript_58017/g.69175  ORF Transcript_58017/g.69175 Transcript_58017/m.69175 type:complete len:205 (+) Transcript_58017:281-895(+)